MVESEIALCEPASGPLATALRHQHPNASVTELAKIASAQIAVCVLDAGDDVSTLMQMSAMLATRYDTASSRPQIIVQIADRILRAALEARLEQDNIQPRPMVVSADDLVAEHFIARHPLFKLAWWREQSRVHVVMVGFGSLGRALLDEIILNGTADGLAIPLIDIVAPNADRIKAALDRDMPDIQASATINCIDLPATDYRSQDRILAQCEATAPITAIFVLLDDRHETLIACADICNRQDRRRDAIAPMFVAGEVAELTLALTTPKRSSRHLATTIQSVGAIGSIDGLLDFIRVGRDVVARRIHEAYQAQYANQTSAGTPWSDLAETYRRANRRAARHLSQKLFVLGIDGRADPARAHLVSPLTFGDLIRPLSQSTVEDDVVRRLARLEHDRWCADRRLDGWVYGDARDDQRHMHPSLVAFDDPRLTASEIEKDIAQLRFLLGSVVAPAEDGASVRMAVGILDQNEAGQPGIDEVDAYNRLDRESDRDLVILSPLRTDAEIEATHALVEHLDGRSRQFRLYVVQRLSEGLDPYLTSVALFHRRGDLLARENTFVVAIGSSAPVPGSDWEDVSADQSATDVLVVYVVTRSDVLLNIH